MIKLDNINSMKLINQKILEQLNKPKSKSYKGQNGRILIIAGSKKYHGALLMSVLVASKLVDMVYVYSTEENFKLVKKLKSEVATFISVFSDELWKTVKKVDAILIGPGLEEIEENKKLVKKLLKNYPKKKVIIDATALWYLNPVFLHSNCIVTPHLREFKQVFKCEPNEQNVKLMAEKYNCLIVYTSKIDLISNGKKVWQNKTGNVGMTKGGTGDVLSGIITALSSTNSLLTSALSGIYLNGLAGDKLYKKFGTFYNAWDLIQELGLVWKKMVN